jgi:hypothetical protein
MLRKHEQIGQSVRPTAATGGLMNNRVDFEIVCPNNHNQTVTFSEEEFDETLKSGSMIFHCNTCDTNWNPSSAEIAQFRKQFPAKAT